MEEYTIYYASNELPPMWWFNPSDEIDPFSKGKINELYAWKVVLFAYLHQTKTFEPLSNEDLDENITDFKYLFKSDA